MYLFETKDAGVSRSYIFGYEKDNPSYEYLKTKVFCEASASDRQEETVYTNNLIKAKEFFSKRLQEMQTSVVEEVFRKTTHKLLFNIFAIAEEVNVCVAFETMNNTGKPLSYLELLKNRLIYLSIKLEVDQFEADKLRTTVNDAWKTIYHNLGKNKSAALDDDFFLRTHHLINFLEPAPDPEDEESYRKRARLLLAVDEPEYRKLLNEIFTFSTIADARELSVDADVASLNRIHEYAMSLQESVKEWYIIFNPKPTNDKDDFNFWLSKINKMSSFEVYPLLLAIMLTVKANSERTLVFKEIEKYLFISNLLSPYYRREYRTVDLLSAAIKLNQKTMSVDSLIAKIRDETNSFVRSDSGKKQLKDSLRNRNFYTWRIIHYFLYEYNLSLQSTSKTDREKIDWDAFIENERDFSSIEHVYPQRAQTTYWRERFTDLTPPQRDLLKNTIGNLLPLSRPKNSSLSNASFPEKVRGKSPTVGFAFGSYAENEVATLYAEWNPQTILDRSLKLLNFMEQRWDILLGKEQEKIELLGLSFIKPPVKLKAAQSSSGGHLAAKPSSRRR